jgi:hypothetical protein
VLWGDKKGEGSATGPANGQSITSRLSDDATCGLCALEADAHKGVASLLVGDVSRLAARDDGPICLGHLHLACSPRTDEGTWKAMLGSQLAAWRALSAELAEFIRKHDYRFQSEPRGTEQGSPWRAVESIAGPRFVTADWPPCSERSSTGLRGCW